MVVDNGERLRIENYRSLDIDIFELSNNQIYFIEILGDKSYS